MNSINLKITPYPYQEEGINKALHFKRCIIGDEPGLGKTLQSIGVVNTANAYPMLIICPSSLKINWEREVEKFTGKKALILNISNKATWYYLLKMGMYHAVIVNYESLRSHFVWDIKGDKKAFRLKDVVFNEQIKVFKSVVIDESHRVKDASTQQTKFAKGICAGKEYVILLSGTPIINRPEDLVSQLSMIDVLKEFGGKSAFLAQYAQGERKASNLPELSERLYEKCLIRRRKSDVLKDLPPKTRIDLYVEISNEEEYRAAETDLKAYLQEYKKCTDSEIRRKMRMKALVQFMELRRLSGRGKVDRAIEFISLFRTSEEKIIVFCAHHDVVDDLQKAFPNALLITGKQSTTDKQNSVDRFQNNPKDDLIICTIKAAGVGYTLTASSNVLFVEFPWTEADCCQCEDRAHRISQKNSVSSYYMIGQNTIDSRLYNIIYGKKKIAMEALGDMGEIPNDEAYFDELVESFLNPDETHP